VPVVNSDVISIHYQALFKQASPIDRDRHLRQR